MLWSLPCVAPASSGSVPPSRERMETWTARVILLMRGSTTSCTPVLCQTRSSSSKMGLLLLNAQKGVIWLKLYRDLARVHWGNLFKNQSVCSAAASLTHIWAWCCHLMLEHTGWGKSQLCLFVHKQLSSVPCLGQNGVWGCQHEKWLAWVKIAGSSCCSYTDTVTNNVCVLLAHMALSLIYFLILCTLPQEYCVIVSRVHTLNP